MKKRKSTYHSKMNPSKKTTYATHFTNKKPSLKKKLLDSKNTAPWKLTSILFFAGMVSLILLIPTVIVVPSATGSGLESTSHDKEEQEQEQQDISVEEEGDAISVAVMRSETEEVETVPLESYVEGVVASEMPVDQFEVEALKAQALAARTYIVDHLLQHADSDNRDVTDTVQHQVYKNEDELRKLWGDQFENNKQKLEEAVSSTEGEILTYKEKPIFAAFFSTSNGFTENSEDYWENELPYLRSVKSPWDAESAKYLDQQTFAIQDVSKLLDTKLPRAALTIETTRTEGNRVEQLTLNDQKFSGRSVREKLGLQSSDFTIEQKGEHLIFTTKGYGHGIGMSQYGANGMAKDGKTYEDIVGHYYQDVDISPVHETAPTLVSK